MIDTTKAREITLAHIQRVQSLLFMASTEILTRAGRHDQSKLTPEELEPLQAMQDLVDREGPAEFGSDEYRRRTAILAPMLKHHYARNSHHPEHYPEGVAGMDLFDLVEMFFDWKAASERGGESCMHIHAAAERFKIEPQLLAILRNTADRLGYVIDAKPKESK